MRPLKVIAVVILLLGVAIIYLFTPPRLGNWRQIVVSFNGITNSSAVLSISNAGASTVVLRDSFNLEYMGVAPPEGASGLTNLMRRTPTGTNLVIASAHQADFLFPLPTEGDRWIANLEFAPAGIRIRFRELLLRQRDPVTTSLPAIMRGVPMHIVTQEFSR